MNEIFAEFAGAFVGHVKSDGDIAFPDKLSRQTLDYSLDSLVEVDAYFAHIFKHQRKIGERGMDNTLLWGGAYVGEVVRRSAKKKYRWVEYEEMITLNPKLAKVIPYTYGTRAVLLSEDGSVTMPVNKVVRLIEEGLENNLHYYAAGER